MAETQTEKKQNNVEVLIHQWEFIKSTARHTGLVAGFGSGKSRAATHKTVEKKKMYPGINVAYYLPTYPLIEDIAYINFEQELTRQNIPYTLNKSSKSIHTPLGKIIFRSMDNPNYIVGYEVGYSVIDEADILGLAKMKKAVVKIVARNRTPLPNGDHNCLDFVSTPEGYQFMYQFFIKKSSEHRKLIRAKTSDNPHLPDDYIETLQDIYTTEELQAYLNGEFVNLTSGTVYYTFDRRLNHTDEEIKPHEVLHIGMDFNITDMNATVGVIRRGKPMTLGEISGVYDTSQMIEQIKERYPRHSVVIYPDASGAARNTTTTETDHTLLKKAKFKVRSPKANPAVKDRVTSMNVGFKNSKGERHHLINTNNCPNLTEALEQQPYKNGVPDKTSGHDHITEANGYFVMGYKKKKVGRVSAG